MSFWNRLAPRVFTLCRVHIVALQVPLLAIDLSNPIFSDGKFTFNFVSSADQLFTVQGATAPGEEWVDLLSRRGDGGQIVFSTNFTGDRQFFRVRSLPYANLDLQPNTP